MDYYTVAKVERCLQRPTEKAVSSAACCQTQRSLHRTLLGAISAVFVYPPMCLFTRQEVDGALLIRTLPLRGLMTPAGDIDSQFAFLPLDEEDTVFCLPHMMVEMLIPCESLCLGS